MNKNKINKINKNNNLKQIIQITIVIKFYNKFKIIYYFQKFMKLLINH